MASLKVIVKNEMGIHCRPSAVIMNAIKGYTGRIYLDAGPQSSAQLISVMDLLSLGLEKDREVTITVEGDDEQAVCKKLAELFETHFDFPAQN